MNLSLFQALGNVLYALGQIFDVGAEGFLGIQLRRGAAVGGLGDVKIRIGFRQFVGKQ